MDDKKIITTNDDIDIETLTKKEKTMQIIDVKKQEEAIKIRKRIIRSAYLAAESSRDQHDKWHSVRNAIIRVLKRSMNLSNHGDCPVKMFHFAVRIADYWGTQNDMLSDTSIERNIRQFLRMQETGKLVQPTVMCDICRKDVPESKIVKNEKQKIKDSICLSCYYAEYAAEPVRKSKAPKTGGFRPRQPKNYRNSAYVYTIHGRFDRIVFPSQPISYEYIKNKNMFLYLEDDIFDGVEFYHKIDRSAGTTHFAKTFDEVLELMEKLQS